MGRGKLRDVNAATQPCDLPVQDVTHAKPIAHTSSERSLGSRNNITDFVLRRKMGDDSIRPRKGCRPEVAAIAATHRETDP